MKISSNILKIFLLDWLITLVMFLTGILVSLLGVGKYVDIVQYTNSLKEGVGEGSIINTFIYLLTSISMVILFSGLINLSKIKAPRKEFFIAQFLYILSIALILILLPVFI